MPTGNEGNFREELCPQHKHVEWTVDYLQTLNGVSSPSFEIETQLYVMEWQNRGYTNVRFLSLRCKGDSHEGSRIVRWWAGLKPGSEIYHHWFESGELGPRMKPLTLFRVTLPEIRRKYLSSGSKPTVTFCLSLQRPSAEMEACTYGANRMYPGISNGIIREEMCLNHLHVEWEVNYEPKRKEDLVLKSPVFTVGDQLYVLEIFHPDLHYIHSPMKLCLFRMGPTVKGSSSTVSWWSGLKRKDGSFHHRNGNGDLNLEEDCTMWRRATELMKIPQSGLLRDHLMSDGKITCFLRLNFKSPQKASEKFLHGSTEMSLRVVGNLTEDTQEVSYKQLRWDVDCEPQRSRDWLTSPVFTFRNHQFLFELDFVGAGRMSINLYRMGPSDEMIKWWLRVKVDRENISNKTVCHKFDTKEECVIWSKMKSFRVPHLRHESKKRILLSVDFLLSLEEIFRTPDEGIVNKGGEDSKLCRRENIVFQVENVEFEIHKAILRLRVPTLGAMLNHDTLESRTGVVDIKDCDPEIFRIFFKFVVFGKPGILRRCDIFDVYTVADKYMVDELKTKCVQYFRELLLYPKCPDSFSFRDAVTLAIRYREDDLLNQCALAFSRIKFRATEDFWKKYVPENPEDAEKLLSKIIEDRLKLFPTQAKLKKAS